MIEGGIYTVVFVEIRQINKQKMSRNEQISPKVKILNRQMPKFDL